MFNTQVKCITIDSSYYPKNLKDIPNPPKRLFVLGDLTKNFFDNCISVVGTRHPTEYGIRVTRKLVNTLNYYKYNIVSGFMYGIDMLVHNTCINNKSRTIAVLPYGINKNFNSKQLNTITNILNNNGLVISEYENEQNPKKYMFVKRNRIVSGLSTKVIITEASLNSGSLTTADIAIKQNRDLYAISGSIDCEVAKGVNYLIKNNKAKLLDDFEIFGIKNDLKKEKINNNNYSLLNTNIVHKNNVKNINNMALHKKDISITQKYNRASYDNNSHIHSFNHSKNCLLILNLLKKEALNIDQLIIKTNLDTTKLNILLSDLMIKEVIKSKGGIYYVI